MVLQLVSKPNCIIDESNLVERVKKLEDSLQKNRENFMYASQEIKLLKRDYDYLSKDLWIIKWASIFSFLILLIIIGTLAWIYHIFEMNKGGIANASYNQIFRTGNNS